MKRAIIAVLLLLSFAGVAEAKSQYMKRYGSLAIGGTLITQDFWYDTNSSVVVAVQFVRGAVSSGNVVFDLQGSLDSNNDAEPPSGSWTSIDNVTVLAGTINTVAFGTKVIAASYPYLRLVIKNNSGAVITYVSTIIMVQD